MNQARNDMESNSIHKATLVIVGASGSVLFAFFFLLTLHTPVWVERFAADFIERTAAKRLDRAIDAIQPPESDSALGRAAASLYQRNQDRIEQYRESLRLRVHEHVADAIAEVRDPDCACRNKWAQWLEAGTTSQIKLLEQSNERLTEFIQSTYARVVTELKRDIRIFTASNALMFLLVLAIVVLKPRAIRQLFVPAVLLVVATLICAYFYVFQQNWLLTLIYSDYLGYTYLAYLAVVFAFLCDIVLNRARVTTELVNAVLHAIGSAARAVPC